MPGIPKPGTHSKIRIKSPMITSAQLVPIRCSDTEFTVTNLTYISQQVISFRQLTTNKHPIGGSGDLEARYTSSATWSVCLFSSDLDSNDSVVGYWLLVGRCPQRRLCHRKLRRAPQCLMPNGQYPIPHLLTHAINLGCEFFPPGIRFVYLLAYGIEFLLHYIQFAKV
jgi:hypothetical protein